MGGNLATVVAMDETEQILEKALSLHRAGKADEARPLYDEILASQPAHGQALYLRGMLALQEGEGELAESLVTRAVEGASGGDEKPDDNLGDYLNGLGQILYFKQDLEGAAVAWARAYDAKPADPGIAYNLGTLAVERLDWAAAKQWLERAENAGAEGWELLANLALVFMNERDYPAAVTRYKKALELAPENAELWVSYANALNRSSEPERAVQALERALELTPDFAPAYLNLANTKMALADTTGALAALEKAIDLDPALDDAHHKRLFFSHYQPDADAGYLHQLHRAWGEAFSAGHKKLPPVAAQPRAGRRLKIGYVSGDLGGHSVGLFMQPLIQAHDRERFEVACYSDLAIPDDLTRAIEDSADLWRETAALSDTELAAIVRRDEIDILIDLTGHTGRNRLGVFAVRPAPLQITYLGYPGTVGLPEIDYRIADELSDPVGAEACSTEKILRLESGFHCFAGPGVDVPLNSLPLATNGYVTFGSFNNIAKSNDDVLALWAKLLVQVPNARLLLKHQNFRHETVRRRFLDAFQSGGVDPARIELRGAEAERVDHLALYGDVDIALDPFPYNGTTTTCEALWMGVPVIGLAGDVLNSGHHARIGESLLTQMELEDLIATSKADYLRIAAELASDGERLREMRKTLRARLQASTLGQIEPFAAKLEAAYEVAWRDGG
ncbi:MAG: tetratricopeptide repeat protein [Rhodospirillaceae bacterium]|nr:tetratricopeptide repeat protein [Rhodospirillaceae bacterium]